MSDRRFSTLAIAASYGLGHIEVPSYHYSPRLASGKAAGSPSGNGRFEDNITKAQKASHIQGLPPHLRVVNDRGRPSHSSREQFYKGKAPKKKRGK